MSDSYQSELKKELRILLDLVQSRPSDDWTRERDRIAVLNNLLARWSQKAAA